MAKNRKWPPAATGIPICRGIQSTRPRYGFPVRKFWRTRTYDLLRFADQSLVASPVRLVYYVWPLSHFGRHRCIGFTNPIDRIIEPGPFDLLRPPTSRFIAPCSSGLPRFSRQSF